jgi:hypothetical protein
VKRWADAATVVLLILLVATYVGAKAHFFLRFGATDLSVYISEHWPFWVGLAGITALISLVSRVGRPRDE